MNGLEIINRYLTISERLKFRRNLRGGPEIYDLVMTQDYPYIQDVISFAFNWSATSEGHKYWYDIGTRLIEINTHEIHNKIEPSYYIKQVTLC